MENIEEIQFKAPIPRQGILLIGDFISVCHHDDTNRDCNLIYNINTTTIQVIIVLCQNKTTVYSIHLSRSTDRLKGCCLF